jgi:hypothetical protein
VSTVLLDDVRAFIRRFVVLDDQQADAVTLWAAATHAFDAFACTPYVAISSAEKRSGKSLLLEVLELLVRDPLPTANISDAALFRVIDERQPTLLIDEIDAVFGKKAREREELRGILNAGYRRGATTHRMGGSNRTKLQTFSVYCPKAFAGIGDCLPDTIADRSIPIRLKRRTRNEPVERFRLRVVEPEGHALRDRVGDWLEPNRDYLADLWPKLPDELDDRAQDVWEPLLAVAEVGGWSDCARAARHRHAHRLALAAPRRNAEGDQDGGGHSHDPNAPGASSAARGVEAQVTPCRSRALYRVYGRRRSGAGA